MRIMKLRKYNYILLTLGLFAIIVYPFPLSANQQSSEDKFYEQIKFERLTTEDGLSNSTVYSIAQDKNGFIWFGTPNGLNKYDGYEFTVFLHSADDSTSLSNNSAGNIFIDEEGILWVGTWGGGLNRFDPTTNKAVVYLNDPDNPNSISGNRVQSIFKDHLGLIWIGTYFNGLSVLDEKTGKFTVFKHDPSDPNSLSNNRIWSIKEDRRGNIWIATSHGLNRFDRRTGNFHHYFSEKNNPHSLSSDLVRCLFVSAFDTLWIGTQNGLNMLDLSTDTIKRIYWQNISSNRFNTHSVTAIFEWQKKDLWIGLGGGLRYMNLQTGEARHFHHRPNDIYSLSENEVRSVFVDNSGTIWIGTRTQGINKIKFRTLEFKNFIPTVAGSTIPRDKVVLSVIEKDNYLWLSTLDRVIRWNRQTDEIKFYFDKSASKNSRYDLSIRDIYASPYKDEIIWMSANQKIIRLNVKNNRKKIYHINNSQYDDVLISRALAMYEAPGGILWLADYTGGLIKYDLKKESIVKQYIHDAGDTNSISLNEVWFIYPQDSTHFWLGTGKGLDFFDVKTEKFKHYNFDPNKKINRRFFTYHHASNGILWFGTDYGLIRYDPATGEYETFTKEDGLPDDKISIINEDQVGNLWLGTEHGLVMFNPKIKKIIVFDRSDGLLNGEYFSEAGFKNKKGELFFGGMDGLDYFYPEQITFNTYDPPVVLTDFKVLNKKVPIGNNSPLQKIISNTTRLRLSYKDYVFSFGFAALDYSNPRKIRYAYKLDGIDNDWIYTDANNRYATYTTLPGGSYIFRVKATNSDGLWGSKQVELHIDIIPPIWEMSWFKYSILTLLILMVFAIFRYRVQKIRERSDELLAINQRLNEQIEERKRAEEEKEKLQQQLIQSQKMEALGTLAGGVAHDFNNLLTIINGHAELMLLNISKEDKFHRHLRAIHQSGTRAAELTRQLLAFSRKQMVKPRILDINHTIEEMNTLLRRLITEDIEIRTELKPGIPNIKADPGQIQQIILNIVINARDAINEFEDPHKEKRITIETDSRYLDEEFVAEHAGSRPGQFVVISISDTGRGINEEDKERIFEPFFTTKEKHKGTGLGLATVYGIVKQNDGCIYVNSVEGSGTRFDIYWPASDMSVVDRAGAESALYAVGRGEHILLVEDDDNIRRFIKDILENYGYKVTEAENGNKAIETLKKNKIKPDMLITDVVMPGLNGRQLADRLKEEIKLFHVLFISGYAFEHLNKEGVMDKNIDFLQKPFTIPSFLQKVREVLDREATVTSMD